MSQEEQKALNANIEAIIRAARAIEADGAKAEDFIRRRVTITYEIGKEMGKSALCTELLG
jgi:hypothetical protein